MALPPSIRRRMASNKGAPVASLTPTAKRDGRPLEHSLPSIPPRISTASEKADFSDMVESSSAGGLLSKPLMEILENAPRDPDREGNPDYLDILIHKIAHWQFLTDGCDGKNLRVELWNGTTLSPEKVVVAPETWGADLIFSSLSFHLHGSKIRNIVKGATNAET